MSKTTVTATQAEPGDPNNPEDWRPAPSDNGASLRAKFLETWGSDAPLDPSDKPTPAKAPKGKTAPPPADADEDLDQDEDEDLVESAEARRPSEESDDDEDEDTDDEETSDDDEEEADDDDKETAAEKDDDSDLDEDDEKEKPDPVAARVQRQEQRMRQRLQQQIDQQRDAARAELAKREEGLQAKEREVAVSKAKYDALASRAETDPLGVLEELLGQKFDVDFVGKQAYLRVKAADDPQYKEAAARARADKEMRQEIEALKKDKAEREQREAEAKKSTEQKQRFDELLGGIAKVAPSIAKATLTQLALKNDPEFAKAIFADAHLEMWRRDGVEPEPRAVVLAAEKIQRKHLRRYGVDPKTLAKASEIESNDLAKPSGKIAGKSAPRTPNGKAKKAGDDDELRMPTKEELLSEDWTS